MCNLYLFSVFLDNLYHIEEFFFFLERQGVAVPAEFTTNRCCKIVP